MLLTEDDSIEDKNERGEKGGKEKKTQIFINGAYFKNVIWSLEFQSS